MEAYDAAVLSYALATAASKGKPSLLGLPPSLSALPAKATDESLTPPREPTEESNVDGRNYLYQLLYNLEQMVINKNTVALSTLMEICSTKQAQVDIIQLPRYFNEWNRNSFFQTSNYFLSFLHIIFHAQINQLIIFTKKSVFSLLHYL